jgi:formylglycine-generating enzyme required for sulfatase activity
VQRAFPWGDVFNSRLANHGSVADEEAADDASVIDGHRHAAPVDAYADGRSFYGALNMAGNVWEWVADWYASRHDPAATRVDPSGPSTGDERVMRGGSWRAPAFMLRTTFRAHLPAAERRPDVGFRCAYPGPEPLPLPSVTKPAAGR